MPKNITLSISDDVAIQMESMPEINWSAVAKNSIRQYIEVRKNPDISEMLEKLRKQQGEEYVNGRKRADEIAGTCGYRVLDSIVKKYIRKVQDQDEREFTRGIEPWESVPTSEEIIQALLFDKKLIDDDVSTEYLKGLRDRLIEIENALTK